MKNVFRWTMFTIANVIVGLGFAFGLMILGRLYVGLQEQPFVLTALVVYCAGVTLAAINYAAKLEAADQAPAASATREPEFDP